MWLRGFEERDWPGVRQVIRCQGTRIRRNVNPVVESNAVRLYQRLGFEILGTVPRAFAHPVLGMVGLHLMYHEF